MKRCVLYGAAGAAAGVAIGLGVGTVVAWAIYPDATALAITGSGGATMIDLERSWQIRATAAACGFAFGLLVSQTALLLDSLPRPRASFCENCGYDFRGHVGGSGSGTRIICPECGTVAR